MSRLRLNGRNDDYDVDDRIDNKMHGDVDIDADTNNDGLTDIDTGTDDNIEMKLAI